MARIYALCLAAGLLLSVRSEACAQDERRVVRGVVVDSTGAGVPYVNVRVGRDLKVTDDSGHFSVALNDRKGRKLEFRRIGFVATDVQLSAGGDTTLSVALIPNPLVLPTAAVQVSDRIRTLERRGFYRRMADREKGINSGHFITAEEIEVRNFPTRFTALLEGAPSVRIHTDNRGFRTPMGTQSGGCVMTTYLDGVRLVAYTAQKLSQPTGFYEQIYMGGVSKPESLGNGLDGLIQTGSVSGVEVYSRGNQAPPEYQALNGSCGVILIWTK